MRAIGQIANVSTSTVSNLLIDAGTACARFHDESVRGVRAKHIKCKDIWSFRSAQNVSSANDPPDRRGDVWIWVALDHDSKLILSFLIGERNGECAVALIDDLRGRLAYRVQLMTDAHSAHLKAVEEAPDDDVNYAQLVKLYGEASNAGPRYSPIKPSWTREGQTAGAPDRTEVPMSHFGRRSFLRRERRRQFSRLANARSTDFALQFYTIALYAVWCNYVRINGATGMPPAMAAGISDRHWNMASIVKLIGDAMPISQSHEAHTRRQFSN